MLIQYQESLVQDKVPAYYPDNPLRCEKSGRELNLSSAWMKTFSLPPHRDDNLATYSNRAIFMQYRTPGETLSKVDHQ